MWVWVKMEELCQGAPEQTLKTERKVNESTWVNFFFYSALFLWWPRLAFLKERGRSMYRNWTSDDEKLNEV